MPDSSQSPLEKFLPGATEVAFALMRVVAGAMFSFHGWQKLFGFLATSQPAVGSQVWVGGIIELVGGTCVALGLFTRIAATLTSGTMAVAYTQFHWKLALGANFFPAINKGELALLYAFVFLFIAASGGGPWSVDALARGRRGAPLA